MKGTLPFLTRFTPRFEFSPGRIGAIWATLAVAIAAAVASAQVLLHHDASLTTYLAGRGRAQDARPLPEQRGVYVDGNGRDRTLQPWRLNADPAGVLPWHSASLHETGVWLDTGTHAITEIDLALPSRGVVWSVGRSFSGRQKDGSSYVASNGYQGKNWFQLAHPELVLFDNDGNAATRQSSDVVYIVYGADRYVEYRRTGDDQDTFRGVNGAAGVVSHTVNAGAPDTYTLHDPWGLETDFFGIGDADIADAKEGQLWRITDPAGNRAYIGHATSASTALAGLDSAGRPVTVFDPAGRRYSYAYSSAAIGGVLRLEEVLVEIEDGAAPTWGSPGTETEVGRVEYRYHDGSNAHGSAGDLKTVTVTLPTDDGTVDEVREQYYRYYTGSTTYGAANQIKYILDPEGCRRFDWEKSGTGHSAGVFDRGFELASDDDIKSFAAAYFEYGTGSALDAERRILKGWFNGQCGCSGAGNGMFEFAYSDNAGFSGTSGYDTPWKRRAVVTYPADSAGKKLYLTQYFDETGQPLSRVLTEGSPTSSPAETWAVAIVRDGEGLIESVHSPENLASYTHSTGTLSQSGSTGLVYYYDRIGAGTADAGMVRSARWRTGAGTSNRYLDSTRKYQIRDKTIGSATLSRIDIGATWVYEDGDETTAVDVTTGVGPGSEIKTNTFSLSFWSDAHSNQGRLAIKVLTHERPAVTTARNGSGAATSTVDYVRTDGTVAFRKELDGVWTYWGLDSIGQASKEIRDVELARPVGTAARDIAAEDDPDPTWGIPEPSTSDELHEAMTYTHDNQGRETSSIIGAGTSNSRASASWYSVLGDRRVATINIPLAKVVGSTTTYYGPASYVIWNHADGAEFISVVGIAAAGTTTTLGSWVSQSGSDPKGALSSSVGPLVRLTTGHFNNTGSQLTATREYHEIPSTLPGTFASNYEETLLGYDNRGREDKSVAVVSYAGSPPVAKGTITRRTFDIRGAIATGIYLGDDDTGWPGGDTGTMQQHRMLQPGTNTGFPSKPTPKYQYGPDGGRMKVDGPVQGEQGDGPKPWEMMAGGGDGEGDGSDGGSGSFSGGDSEFQCRVIVPHLTQPITRVRVTERGWVSVVARASSPHDVYKINNRGHVMAIGRYASEPSPGIDPISVATDRRTLVENERDEIGGRYRIRAWEINQATGAKGDARDTWIWYDSAGRVVKVRGEQVAKRQYDSLGRLVREYILAEDDDDTYGDVDDVSGDIVLEERIWAYEAGSGDLLFSASIQRHHTDRGSGETTGPLDTNADGDQLKLTAADLKGRASIRAYWHDDQGRVVDSVEFGTYGGATFDRGSMTTAPARSDTALVTSYEYGVDGNVIELTDPRGLVNRIEHDDAGRMTLSIRNYTGATPPLTGSNRDNDLYTRFVHGERVSDYFVNKLWVDVDGDGAVDSDDQVTTYRYGVSDTSSPSSDVALPHALFEAKYPDSSSGTDVVRYGYGRNAELVTLRDQEGSELEIEYDSSGRTTKRVSTPASGSVLDTLVKSVHHTYDDLGRLSTVQQKDSSTVVLDEVKMTYDGWGNLTTLSQDHDSVVGGSGLAAFEVEHTFALKGHAAYVSSANLGRNTLRRTQTVLPGDYTIGYEYLSTGDRFDDISSRVSRMTRGTVGGGSPTTVVEYEYLGAGRVVGIEYPEPDVFRRHYGTSAGSYPELDRFGRTIVDRWTKDLTTDRHFFDQSWAFDRNSNPTTVEDHVLTEPSNSKGLFDVSWSLDEVDRVVGAHRGHWTGTALTDTKHVEDWDYTVVGGWDLYKLDLDGDGLYTGSGELKDDQTINAANEVTARDTNDDGTNDLSPTWTPRGELADDGEKYTHTYDAWGRLRTIKNRSTNALVSEYWYNGLGYLIRIHQDRDGDGDVDSNDGYERLVYDERWRVVAVHLGSSTHPLEMYVHHGAGFSGRGGSSYVDALVLRDRDSLGSDPPTLNERIYYCQNMRQDVVAIVKGDGSSVIEQVRYSAYGVPFCLPAGDCNSDGKVNVFDSIQINNWRSSSTYDVRGDLDLDGDVDLFDVIAWGNRNGDTGGHGVLSRSNGTAQANNRFGYAGYLWQQSVAKNHVRNRVYDPHLGRWLTRDPIEYAAGVANLYEYVAAMPVATVDTLGLQLIRVPTWHQPQLKPDTSPPGPRVPPGYPPPGTDGELRIYIDLPGWDGETHDMMDMAWEWPPHDVGHAFIRCQVGSWDSGRIGNYPGGPRDDSDATFEHLIRIPITSEEASHVVDFIRDNADCRYSLLDYNCSNYARDAIRSIPRLNPHFQHPDGLSTPGSLYEELDRWRRTRPDIPPANIQCGDLYACPSFD